MLTNHPQTSDASRGQIIALFVLLLMFGFAFKLPDAGVWQQWDKAIHTVAGGALALLFYPYAKKASHLVLFVFIIGLIFEAAEFITVPFGPYKEVDRYIIDTALDLIVDTLGAVVAIQVKKLIYG